MKEVNLLQFITVRLLIFLGVRGSETFNIQLKYDTFHGSLMTVSKQVQYDHRTLS